MENKKITKLSLCAPCCNKCPEISVEKNMVIITDDNDEKTEGIRKIKLTKEQFSILLSQGKNII